MFFQGIRHDPFEKEVEDGGWQKTSLPYSDYCSELFSYAAIQLDCTCSFVIELLNGANEICHLYEKQLFTWLSLVVSLIASFVLFFFPLDVLDEIWDLIESVSEGFLTYSCTDIVLPHGGQ